MKLILVLLLSFPIYSLAQSNYQKAVDAQNELNSEFADKEKTPLTKKDFKKFKELPFFPIDTQYAVVAMLEFTPEDTVFKMKTTTDRLPEYRRAAIATFKINGVEYKLNLYKSLRLQGIEKYKNYYFLPYKDKTCGSESYGGGRFLDFDIENQVDEILIDFNMSYNPLCAYNEKYSCPIVPSENYIDVEVKAGVKAPANH